MIDKIKQHLHESSNVKRKLAENFTGDIKKIVNKFVSVLQSGKKILICGNGGSAADAQHIATEFVVRLRAEFPREALPVISLSTNTSCLTACANDFSYDRIFSRQIEALGKPGDLVLGISTSGNSPNILEAFRIAKELNMNTILLGGKGGGKAKNIADLSIIVPSNSTMRIQESHITIAHIITELTENVLFNQ
mgnify:CR=1 FL=1